MTGNIFILVPSTTCSKLKDQISQNTVSVGSRSGSQLSTRWYPMHLEVMCSPHNDYITRHMNGNNRDFDGGDPRPGFLWFWNHMVSQRWKSSSTPATGDKAFQNKILKDFREFCSNQDNRLKVFWDSSYEALKKATLKNGQL